MIYWRTKILCAREDGRLYYRNPPYIRVGDVAVTVNMKTMSFKKKKIVDVHKIRNNRGFRLRTERRYIDAHPTNYFAVRREGSDKLIRMSEIKTTDLFLFELIGKDMNGYVVTERPLSVVPDTAFSRFYDVVVESQQRIDVFVANHFLLGILRKG